MSAASSPGCWPFPLFDRARAAKRRRLGRARATASALRLGRAVRPSPGRRASMAISARSPSTASRSLPLEPGAGVLHRLRASSSLAVATASSTSISPRRCSAGVGQEHLVRLLATSASLAIACRPSSSSWPVERELVGERVGARDDRRRRRSPPASSTGRGGAVRRRSTIGRSPTTAVSRGSGRRWSATSR